MRLSTASLLPVAAALLALSAAAPALAAPGDGEPGAEATEAAEAGSDATKAVAPAGEAEPAKTAAAAEAGKTETVVKAGDGDAVVEVVETTKDGKTTTVVKVVEADEGDEDDGETMGEIVEEIVEEEHHHHRELKWLGLHAGMVLNAAGGSGRVSDADGRLRQNQFKACADPAGETLCGYVKGLDLKVQMFETEGTWRYPTFVGYFRTGFEQGRVHVQPGEDGFAPGDATRLDYTSVPLFLGGSVYLFEEFPVRPYGGLGFGFDVLRLDYRLAGGEGRRGEPTRTVDASARIGFELHAGLEVRISNYVALSAEVMQLWSARRKMPRLPDYSNTGLSVLAGVTVGIPVRLDRRGDEHHTKTTRKIRRIERD